MSNNHENTVKIFTDGCCLKDDDSAGGWGAVLEYKGVIKWWNGRIEAPTTSNRAEIIAMIEALKRLTRPCDVVIYSDSQVAVRCASGEYGRNANPDLWEALDIAEGLHNVTYEWIRGHNGTPGNERAHMLAERGAKGLIEDWRDSDKEDSRG